MASMPYSLAVRAKSRWSSFLPKSARWRDHSAREISKVAFLSRKVEQPPAASAADARAVCRTNKRRVDFMVSVGRSGQSAGRRLGFSWWMEKQRQSHGGGQRRSHGHEEKTVEIHDSIFGVHALHEPWANGVGDQR